MVSDCCGAISESDHLGALKRFERDYGLVASSEEVMKVWTERASKSEQDGTARERLSA
jgi:ureidoacrylate peracid hydrolase